MFLFYTLHDNATGHSITDLYALDLVMFKKGEATANFSFLFFGGAGVKKWKKYRGLGRVFLDTFFFRFYSF